MLTAVLSVHIDCVQTDVIPVQDAQADGANFVIDGDGGHEGLLWDCRVHGGDDAPVGQVGGVFQTE